MAANFAARAIAVALLAAALAGCAAVPAPEARIVTQRVDVPVAVKAAAPVNLMQPYTIALGDMPVWIAPSDKTATSCLAPEGEAKLRNLVDGLLTRDDAWHAWAAAPLPAPSAGTTPAPSAATAAHQ